MKKWIWISGIFLALLTSFVVYRILHRDLFMCFAFEPYVLSDEQVEYMKDHPKEKPLRLSAKELYGKKVNVVVRVINEGEVYTGGPLYYRIEGDPDWHEIIVEEISPINSKTGVPQRDYVIPVGMQFFSQTDKPFRVELNSLKMWKSDRPGKGELLKDRYNDHKPFFPRQVSQEELFQVLDQCKKKQ